MSGSRIEDTATDVAADTSDTETADVEAQASEEVVERPSRRHFFLGAAAVATADPSGAYAIASTSAV